MMDELGQFVFDASLSRFGVECIADHTYFLIFLPVRKEKERRTHILVVISTLA